MEHTLTLTNPLVDVAGDVLVTDRNMLWLLDHVGALRTKIGHALRGNDPSARRELLSEHLPPCLAEIENAWLSRFEDSVIALQQRIKSGQPPYPESIAEEVALYAALVSCQRELDSTRPPTSDPWYTSLPAAPSDFDVEHLRTVLLTDDVELLFDPAFYIDDTEDDLADVFGVRHPSKWFEQIPA